VNTVTAARSFLPFYVSQYVRQTMDKQYQHRERSYLFGGIAQGCGNRAGLCCAILSNVARSGWNYAIFPLRLCRPVGHRRRKSGKSYSFDWRSRVSRVFVAASAGCFRGNPSDAVGAVRAAMAAVRWESRHLNLKSRHIYGAILF